jgi:hypothetical protein
VVSWIWTAMRRLEGTKGPTCHAELWKQPHFKMNAGHSLQPTFHKHGMHLPILTLLILET